MPHKQQGGDFCRLCQAAINSLVLFTTQTVVSVLFGVKGSESNTRQSCLSANPQGANDFL